MKQSHNTLILRGSLPRRKLRPQELVFILYLERVNMVPLQPDMQLEIFWETLRSQPEPFSLRYILFYSAFFLQHILFLSQSLWIVTFILKDSATSYSKIMQTKDRTRARLFYNILQYRPLTTS